MSRTLPTISLALFKPGTIVYHNNKQYTVSHVRISTKKMVVFLSGYEDPFDPTELHLKETVIDFEEQRQIRDRHILEL